MTTFALLLLAACHLWLPSNHVGQAHSACHAFFPGRFTDGGHLDSAASPAVRPEAGYFPYAARGSQLSINGFLPGVTGKGFFGKDGPIFTDQNFYVYLNDTCHPMQFAVLTEGGITVVVPPDAPIGQNVVFVAKGKYSLLASFNVTITEYAPSFTLKELNVPNQVSGLAFAFSPNNYRFVNAITPENNLFDGVQDDETLVIWFNITGFYFPETTFFFVSFQFDNQIFAAPALISNQNDFLRVQGAQWLIVTIPNDLRHVQVPVNLSFPLIRLPALLKFS